MRTFLPSKPLAATLALLLAGALSGRASADPTVRPASEAERGEPPLDPDRFEFGVLPALTGSTDAGVAAGVTATVAKFGEAYHPYRYRADLQAAVNIKGAPEGGVELPVRTVSLSLDLPGRRDERHRVIAGLYGTWDATSPYYGIGNASPFLALEDRRGPETEPEQGEGAYRYYQFRHLELGVSAAVRYRLGHDVSWFLTGNAAWHSITSYAGSKLAEDARGDSGRYVQSATIGIGKHGRLLGTTGFLYDSRDHETNPSRGMFHDVSMRIGQGLGTAFTYGGVNLTTRFYIPLWEDRLVLASRLITDVLFGTPPFYRLTLFGGLLPGSGPGGGGSVRGVPIGRYAGKIKLIGNVELRSMIASFTLFDQRLRFGVVAFADAGRVWADTESHPELDADAPAIKVGAGGGLRLQWGEAFLIRLDVGGSPDGLGVVFTVNHLF